MTDGATLQGREQVLHMRAFVCWQAIKMHISSRGGMMMTRMATPANLRAIATEFTGTEYKRSAKGLRTAFNDLSTYLGKDNTIEAQ